MVRKNSSSDKEQELNELITSYEAAKKENKQLYLDGDQLADIADKYAADRRFNDAQEVIDYGLELHPGHTDLMVEQAYLYLDTMELQKAKNVAECITETYDSDVKLLKAEILLNEGNLDEAEKLLDTIEEKDSLNTILDVSYLYMDMGYPEKALPWLTRNMEEYEEEEDLLAAIADCYHSGEHDEKAIHIYNKLIDKNPYNPTYWTGLAKSHFNRQEYDKTVEACDFALAADENFGEAHLMKAHSLFHLENETEAIQEYQLALKNKEIPPEFAYMFIGLAYANQGNWELACRSYQQALEIIGDENSPILADLFGNIAFCFFKLGKHKEAHNVCKKVRKIMPESVEIYLQEGRIYLEEKKLDKAKECWELALKYAPGAETLMQISDNYLECGMIEDARLCFERIWKIEPDYPGINARLASICMLLKDHEGFSKYNQLAKNPFSMEALQEAVAEGLDENILKIIEDFIDGSDEFENKDTDNEEKDDNKEVNY